MVPILRFCQASTLVSFLYYLDTGILSGAHNGFYLEILSGTCNGILYLILIPVFLQTSSMAWFGDDFAEDDYKVAGALPYSRSEYEGITFGCTGPFTFGLGSFVLRRLCGRTRSL